MEPNWTIMQRSKHYSVSRMVLCEKPETVKFMLIVTDPPIVSTREIIKKNHLCHTQRVHRVGTKLVKAFDIEYDQATCAGSASTRKQNVDCRDRGEREEIIENVVHDDRAEADVIDGFLIGKNGTSSAKADVVEENESNVASNTKVDKVNKNERGDASGATSDEVSKGESDKVPQVCFKS